MINKKELFMRAVCRLSKKKIDKEVMQRKTSTNYLSKVFSTPLFTD